MIGRDVQVVPPMQGPDNFEVTGIHGHQIHTMTILSKQLAALERGPATHPKRGGPSCAGSITGDSRRVAMAMLDRRVDGAVLIRTTKISRSAR